MYSVVQHLDENRIKRSRIAIVDDEEADVMLLKRVLDWAGYPNVTGWTEPREALEKFRFEPPDLLIVDLNMPGRDGFDVIARIRSFGFCSQELPILVLTGDPRPDVKRRALALGANDFVTKPADATEIMIRVRNYLETRELYRQLEILSGSAAA